MEMEMGIKRALESRQLGMGSTVVVDAHDGHTGEQFKLQYEQQAMVGHGSFGYVYQINILPKNVKAATKSVLQDMRFKNRELEIMKLIRHQNIVDLLAYYYQKNEKDELYLYLILEFVPETLFTNIQYYYSRKMKMPQLLIKLYSYQILRSMNYIHSLGICHRDIKPQNLLINPTNGVLKLCDFGSAKILRPNEPNVSYICSRYYRAPELIFGARNYTTKIDVWSTGCVIAEMCLGQPLFPGQSGIDQLVEIIKLLGTPSKDDIKSMNPNYMDHKFPSIKPIPLTKIFGDDQLKILSLFNKMFHYSPLVRSSAIECLVDEFFDEFREESFYTKPLPNFRNYNLSDEIFPPDLLNFDKRELSVAPELIHSLVPSWKKDTSLDTFKPYTKEELENHLNN